MNALDPLELANYLDASPAWQPSAEVRCAKGCTLARAWAMPSGQVVVLVNPKYRVSPQWREGRIGKDATLPAWLPADVERIWEPVAYVMEAAPGPHKPALATLCRHAQKYPITASALELWQAAHDPAQRVVEAPIPDVQQSRADDKLRLRLAPIIGALRRLARDARLAAGDTPDIENQRQQDGPNVD